MCYKSWIMPVLALYFASFPTAYAESGKESQVTLITGNWTILRSIDAMKDKVTCTGLYKANKGIQLVSDALYIAVNGGIQSIRLRLGETPARAIRLPRDVEQSVGAVVIDGSDFADLLQSTRLRVRILTMVRGVITEDLDTTGMLAALEHIHAGCPVPEKQIPAEGNKTSP